MTATRCSAPAPSCGAWGLATRKSRRPCCARWRRMAAQRNPAASMLYLEVSEQGNPRSSFDINLYKSGLVVADAGQQLRQAGAYFHVAGELIEAQLMRLGTCPLGHLSSGPDRKGKEFLAVYGETVAL